MDTTRIDVGLSAAPSGLVGTSSDRHCRLRVPETAAGQFEVDWQLPCQARRDAMR